MSHWNKGWNKALMTPKDELFWHATTSVNVKRIFGSAEGVKPEMGTGANGPGFYVTPRCTDYGKVMAFRNQKDGDPKELFILKILVEGFYGMKPFFSEGLAGALGADVCDFVGSRWDPTVIGPSGNKKPDGTQGQYNAYQGVPLSTPGYNQAKAKLEYRGKVVKGAPPLKGAQAKEAREARDARRKRAVDALWDAAKTDKTPEEGTGSKKMDLLIQSLGPRKAFLYSLEELTFKKQTGPGISVVGARKFYAASPDDQLVNWFDNDTEVELDEVEKILELGEYAKKKA
jgi:hypothetical protein